VSASPTLASETLTTIAFETELSEEALETPAVVLGVALEWAARVARSLAVPFEALRVTFETEALTGTVVVYPQLGGVVHVESRIEGVVTARPELVGVVVVSPAFTGTVGVFEKLIGTVRIYPSR
jgi:hypothetical protein